MEIVGNFNDVTELQKYMNFSKFIDLLETKKIFLSKASGFEDKTEGELSLEFKMIDSGDAMLIDIAMNCNIPRAAPLSQDEIRRENKIRDEAISKYDNRVIETCFGDFSVNEISYEEINNQYKEWVDISCWHANKYESMAMWKIYGENEGAVCVITDLDRMKNSILSTGNYNLIISKVYYISHQDESFNNNHKLSRFMHKSRFYDYEQEVRLIGYNSDCPFLEKRTDFGTKIEIDIYNFIKEIRVSPYAPNWFFDLVKSVCKKYNITTNVIRSKIYGTI